MAWTNPRTWVTGETVTAAIVNPHVRDNLQSGPIASTVTALNALVTNKSDGCRGYIRVGSSPYDIVSLVWNLSAGAWQEEDAELVCQVLTDQTTSATTYTVAAGGAMMSHKVFTDAGLVLQVRVQALLTAGASSTVIASCLASTGNLAGAMTLDSVNNTGIAQNGTTSQITEDSGWVALNGSVTPKDYVQLSIGMTRTGAANGTVKAGTALWQRWSS
jgi:hypothetical protein